MKWFVSYPYGEEEAIERLRATIGTGTLCPFAAEPRGAEVPVTDKIIAAMRACDGLVQIRSGRFSLWSEFERQFFKRDGRQVIIYHADEDQLVDDPAPPVPLDVEVYFGRRDEALVTRMLDWLAMGRSFDLKRTRGAGLRGGVKGDDMISLQQTAFEGGVVLWLLGPQTWFLYTQFLQISDREFRQEALGFNGLWDDEFEALLARFPDTDEDDLDLSRIDPMEFIYPVVASLKPGLADEMAEAQGEFGRAIDLVPEGEGNLDWSAVGDMMMSVFSSILKTHQDDERFGLD